MKINFNYPFISRRRILKVSKKFISRFRFLWFVYRFRVFKLFPRELVIHSYTLIETFTIFVHS